MVIASLLLMLLPSRRFESEFRNSLKLSNAVKIRITSNVICFMLEIVLNLLASTFRISCPDRHLDF